MATVREKLLPVVAKLRGIADTKMGLRRYDVYLRRTTPSGGRMGLGATNTNVDTLLAERPVCRPAGGRDVVAGGGAVKPGDWLMERVTPRNDADTVGTLLSTIVRSPSSPGQKVVVVLVGPDMPAYVASPPSGGGEFTLETLDPSRNFEFRFVLHPYTGHR